LSEFKVFYQLRIKEHMKADILRGFSRAH